MAGLDDWAAARQFWIVPEVAGGFGNATRLSKARHRFSDRLSLVSVDWLEYRFDGWMGDAIVCFLNVYAVTEPFAAALTAGGLTGFELREMDVIASDVWEQACEIDPKHPRKPPPMKQLIPLDEREIQIENGTLRLVSESATDVCFGIRRIDDGAISSPNRMPYNSYALVVSRRFLDLARKFGLENADIFPVAPGD